LSGAEGETISLPPQQAPGKGRDARESRATAAALAAWFGIRHRRGVTLRAALEAQEFGGGPTAMESAISTKRDVAT
jgi:hypothetical protein